MNIMERVCMDDEKHGDFFLLKKKVQICELNKWLKQMSKQMSIEEQQWFAVKKYSITNIFDLTKTICKN